jgi:hypothetical protein
MSMTSGLVDPYFGEFRKIWIVQSKSLGGTPTFGLADPDFGDTPRQSDWPIQFARFPKMKSVENPSVFEYCATAKSNLRGSRFQIGLARPDFAELLEIESRPIQIERTLLPKSRAWESCPGLAAF